MCRHFQKSEAIDQKYHLVGICCIESLYVERIVTYEKNALFLFQYLLECEKFYFSKPAFIHLLFTF